MTTILKLLGGEALCFLGLGLGFYLEKKQNVYLSSIGVGLIIICFVGIAVFAALLKSFRFNA